MHFCWLTHEHGKSCEGNHRDSTVTELWRNVNIATFTVHVNITHGRQNLSTLNQLLKLTSAYKLYSCMMFAQILLFTYTQGNIFLLSHNTDVFNCTGWSWRHSLLAMLGRNNLHEYLYEMRELIWKKRDRSLSLPAVSKLWVWVTCTCAKLHALYLRNEIINTEKEKAEKTEYETKTLGRI